MRSPYYQEQVKVQQDQKDKDDIEELEQMTKDAFKDPMQEMIEKYAGLADQKAEIESANVTSSKN